jgi:hypothetical protein
VRLKAEKNRTHEAGLKQRKERAPDRELKAGLKNHPSHHSAEIVLFGTLTGSRRWLMKEASSFQQVDDFVVIGKVGIKHHQHVSRDGIRSGAVNAANLEEKILNLRRDHPRSLRSTNLNPQTTFGDMHIRRSSHAS